MLNLLKKTANEKTTIQITPSQKATTTVANVAGKVKTGAFGAAVVGAGAAIVQGIFDPVVDVSMLEIEPEAYCKLHNKAGEFENAETGSEETDEQNAEQPAEHAEDEGTAEDDKAEIVHEQNAEQHADPAPKAAEKPIVEATATEVESEQAPAAPADKQPAEKTPAGKQPADPAPVATQTEQGNNAQQPKSDADKQKPNGSSQGASNNNPKNGNNHAKAAK